MNAKGTGSSFSALEQAELRRLVFRAHALKEGKPGYHEALEAIETWDAESLPNRLRRKEQASS